MSGQSSQEDTLTRHETCLCGTMKRLRAVHLETSRTMALWYDPTESSPSDTTGASEVRQLLHRASAARLRGQHAVADDLRRDARALVAALAQYEAARADVRQQVSDLADEVQTFWDRVSDDRTLHELADDACVLLALCGDLDRAQERLIILEMTRP